VRLRVVFYPLTHVSVIYRWPQVAIQAAQAFPPHADVRRAVVTLLHRSIKCLESDALPLLAHPIQALGAACNEPAELQELIQLVSGAFLGGPPCEQQSSWGAQEHQS
jgi:hypothetical protein